MQEVTRVVTVEITSIFTKSKENDYTIKSAEQIAEEFVQFVMSKTDADNVNVVKVQDFVRDIEVPFETGSDE